MSKGTQKLVLEAEQHKPFPPQICPFCAAVCCLTGAEFVTSRADVGSPYDTQLCGCVRFDGIQKSNNYRMVPVSTQTTIKYREKGIFLFPKDVSQHKLLQIKGQSV